MTNYDLGYSNHFEKFRVDHQLTDFEFGRVILEHKERYIIKSLENEFEAELIGNLRFNAESRYDFPCVGDWVAFSAYDNNKALIHSIFPRTSIIERQAVGKFGQIQIIATNIDFGLIVQSVDRDFNINRLERYLTICYTAKVEPVIVISKVDTISKLQLESLLIQIANRLNKVKVVCVSNKTIGYIQLEQMIKRGKTYCLLGSSGVGKSTLLNHLCGKNLMKTGTISTSIHKGKHVTSHRELIVLENGGILIDNPGLREVGITNINKGLETTFDTIFEYAKDCRFKNCSHIHEYGCAILKALENGKIDKDSYTNFQKMEKEKLFFESDMKERKQKDKSLGKMIKNVKKQRKLDKY